MNEFPLSVGDVVKTSYGTGPYRILAIGGPCTCYPYHVVGGPKKSTPHYHLEVEYTDIPSGGKNRAYLGGVIYRDGKFACAWSPDEYEVVERADQQGWLFV